MRPDTDAPKPTQYNIIIPSVPMWKIRSIARYKRLNYLRSEHEKKDAPAKKQEHSTEDADTESVNKLMNDAPMASKLQLGHGPPDPMLGLTIANKSMLQNLSNDEILEEMDKMNSNCTLIKNEMVALEKFRCNLTWLLEKSTMFKVQRNHNKESLLWGTKGNPKKRYRSMTSSPEPSSKRPASVPGL